LASSAQDSPRRSTFSADLLHRTSFAPETTSPRRNERDRTQTNRSKSTKRIDMLPFITVWLQIRVLPGPPVNQ
jgi:hypothetical protein